MDKDIKKNKILKSVAFIVKIRKTSVTFFFEFNLFKKKYNFFWVKK